MAQVINFPGATRSESERVIREVLSQMRPGEIPEVILDQVAKSVATAAEKWAFEVQLKYTLPPHFGPDVVKEVQRIADDVARQATNQFKAKVLLERVFFELELAGVKFVPRK